MWNDSFRVSALTGRPLKGRLGIHSGALDGEIPALRFAAAG